MDDEKDTRKEWINESMMKIKMDDARGSTGKRARVGEGEKKKSEEKKRKKRANEGVKAQARAKKGGKIVISAKSRRDGRAEQRH